MPPALRSFEGDECKLRRLPALGDCPELVRFVAAKGYVDDLGPLAGHPALRVLGLPHNRVQDVRPLATARGLRSLDLDANPIESVDVLSTLPELSWLSLRQTPLSGAPPTFPGVTVET